MRLSENTFLYEILVFIATICYPVYQLIAGKQADLGTVIVTVIGFFGFIMIDQRRQTMAMQKLEATFRQLTAPGVQRMSSIEAFEYCCGKAKSAERIYNTSFTVNEHFVINPLYRRWIQCIVEGVIDNKCVVTEVMLSRVRYEALCEEFRKHKNLEKGYYTANIITNLHNPKNIPLIELSIFDYGADGQEVIFGWASSFFQSIDCFLVRDRAVVGYFLSYFSQFRSLGETVTIPPIPDQERSED